MSQDISFDTIDIERISDPTYREKFVDVPKILDDWTAPYGGLAGKDILDFGCGEATCALSIALRYNARRVVGVETHKEIDNCLPYAQSQLGLSKIPAHLELVRLAADSSLEQCGHFDFIYSWSVFEHVSQDYILDCFKKMKKVLRADGVMFMQTAPLDYSAGGAHVRWWAPEPWVHLRMQTDLFYDRLRLKLNEQEFEAQKYVYETLNRATASELLRAAAEAGFEVTREHRTYDEIPIPEDLKEIFREDVLTTNQLVFLAKHA